MLVPAQLNSSTHLRAQPVLLGRGGNKIVNKDRHKCVYLPYLAVICFSHGLVLQALVACSGEVDQRGGAVLPEAKGQPDAGLIHNVVAVVAPEGGQQAALHPLRLHPQRRLKRG